MDQAFLVARFAGAFLAGEAFLAVDVALRAGVFAAAAPVALPTLRHQFKRIAWPA